MRLAGPTFAIVVVAMASVAGCADIWGFQDAVDLRDGSALPTADGAPHPAGACRCIAQVPDGWAGPFEIADESDPGAADASTVACGAAYPTSVFVGVASPVAPRATCTCSCGAPTNACSGPVLHYFKDNGCTMPCGPAGPGGQALAGACAGLTLGDCPGGARLTIDAPLPDPGGACVPAATAVVPPLTWSTRSHLCAPLSPPVVASCDGGNVCAAATDPAFEAATYCVTHAGTTGCPSAFPRQTVLYAAGADDRGCAACTCGAPTGVVCGGAKVSLSKTSGCGAASASLTAPAACTSLGGTSSATFIDDAPVAGSCTPSGGEPSGVATLSPTTVCCTP